jgi:glucokinase
MDRIGIDIGGTSAKVGLVGEAGTVLRRAQLPTGRDLPAAVLVETLAQAVAEVHTGNRAGGLGVAAPGFRRPDGEGVVNVGNLPLIDGFPLRSRLEAATGLPTVLDNDANAAAVGEYRYGGGKGVARLLVVTVGTGIGAGMVVEGKVLRACWEGLGDPGHVIVQAGGPRCNCGGHGCAEAVASVPAILRRARELAVPGAAPADLGAVVRAARQGDTTASQALQEAGRYLGLALASLTHLLGPDCILLGGGGLDAAENLLMDPAREALLAHVQPFFGKGLTLGRAALGNDAGLIGAAALIADEAI